MPETHTRCARSLRSAHLTRHFGKGCSSQSSLRNANVDRALTCRDYAFTEGTPIMAQTDYRAGTAAHPVHENAEGIMDQVSEIGERAGTMANELGTAIKEHPYTTLAVAAGLAFAVGALWKLGRQRQPQSRLDAWLGQLPELPSRESLLPRRWR